MVSRFARLPYPLKVRRLEQLDEVGLNVADFVCFAPKQLKIGELRDFCKRFKAVSCRTFAADEDQEFKTPVKYEISDTNAVIEFAKEHNNHYFVLVNEALPLKDSIIAGNIWFKSKDDFLCEYFRGPGTPRDLETKSIFRAISERDVADTWLSEMLEAVSRFPYRSVIFEFSVYPYPVGQRQTSLVFWEWRKF